MGEMTSVVGELHGHHRHCRRLKQRRGRPDQVRPHQTLHMSVLLPKVFPFRRLWRRGPNSEVFEGIKDNESRYLEISPT